MFLPLNIVRQYQKDAVAHVANEILSDITHSNILGFYAKKNLIQLGTNLVDYIIL